MGVRRACAIVVVPVAVAVNWLTVAPAAQADAFAYACDDSGAGFEPCRQDNGGVVWCQAASLNGFPDLKAATGWAIDAIAGTTDLTASLASTCSSATDDITFRRQDLGTNTLGATWCTDPDTTANRCNAAVVATDFGTQQYAIDDPYDQVPFRTARLPRGSCSGTFA